MKEFPQKMINRVIDNYCTFSYLLKYSDYNRYNSLDGYSGTIFCPFHDNLETPAARIYPKRDEQECEQIYCFSENKLYRPHDCCRDYSRLIKYDTNTVFSVIWSHLSESEKAIFTNETNIVRTVLEGYENVFKSYRRGEVDLFHTISCVFYSQ